MTLTLLSQPRLAHLQSFFSQGNLQLELVYKGSLHGFDLQSFHLHCGKLERSVVVVQSEMGKVFGGYSDLRF
jgi:hypothetical protein